MTVSEREEARRLSARQRVVLALVAIAGLSIVLRIWLVGLVPGPWIFMDELGYHRLAYSLGESGRLELYGREGLSYSPLYSAFLAPIYALGASAPTAYELSKIFNAVVMSLAVVPIYRIARFVLPRRPSLVVAVLAALAPLMFYTALAMSESLAYPLFLLAIWAMLVAVRAPSLRADAMLLAAIVAVSAARIQLAVLYPVALTAVMLAGALSRDGSRLPRRVVLALSHHPMLLGAGVLAAVAAAARGIAGGDIFAVAGRYANVSDVGFPSPWRVLESSLDHLAGLDLALGAIPFAGALVAAYVFVRRGARRDVVVFASVALSATLWLVVEVGYNRAAFARGADLPRIHERYLFYLVPLFLVALVAATRLRAATPPFPVYLGAVGVTALLPVAIPFESVINNTIVADSFGLLLYGRDVAGEIVASPHAKLSAVNVAALLGLIYVLLRQRPRGVAATVAIVFVLMSGLVGVRLHVAAKGATEAVLPSHRDWVDRTKPAGDVVLIGASGATRLALLETAFHNVSIGRLYYVCTPAFWSEFGERELAIDAAGRLRDGDQVVSAAYAVVPATFGVRGRVIARNAKGRLVLVATPGGRLNVPPGRASCA